VALRTGNGDVRTRERERRSVVIEGRCGPGRGVMAILARSRETRSGVIRIRRPCVVGLVTRIAIRGHRRVVVVRMALRAGNGDMRACEWKRRFTVVEYRLGPGRGVMASLAGSRETAADVIGICRPGKVHLVTGVARRGRVYVAVIRMALRASHCRVHSGKRIVGKNGVIKFRV
jgi:hypothetical protein